MGYLGKAQRQAKKFYDTWRKTGSHSPALKAHVRVSLKGWRHITGATGYKKRSGADTYRRLKLLPVAKKIIETSTTVQNVTDKNGRKFYAFESVEELLISSKKKFSKVRVIFEEDHQGNKVFLSVMDRKNRKS